MRFIKMRVARLDTYENAQKLSDIINAALLGDPEWWNNLYPNDPPLQLDPSIKLNGYIAETWADVLMDQTGKDDKYVIYIPDNDPRIQWILEQYPQYLDLLRSRFSELSGFDEMEVSEDWVPIIE